MWPVHAGSEWSLQRLVVIARSDTKQAFDSVSPSTVMSCLQYWVIHGIEPERLGATAETCLGVPASGVETLWWLILVIETVLAQEGYLWRNEGVDAPTLGRVAVR